MEAGSIPSTPPPPYQTLPPTPMPTPALNHSSVHVPATANAPSQSTPSVSYPPALYAHTHHVHPHYHGNLMNLPYRPVHHCIHPMPYQHPVNPVYYAHYTGGHSPAPIATALARPQQRPWRSYLQVGSIAATLNDAGNLAVEAYDAIASPRSTREQYGGALDAVALRLDNVLTSMDDGTYQVNSADLGE